MDRQEMLQILTDLDEQLSNTEDLDEYHRSKTIALSQHIKRALSDGDDRLSGDEFLTKKIKDAIDDFEINHPQLTTIVGRISDLLAGSGL